MLPQLIHLPHIDVFLSTVQPLDYDFYRFIYTHPELMAYIKFYQSDDDISAYFTKLCHWFEETGKTEFSYVIKQQDQNIGILGIKTMPNNQHEMGVIIEPTYQGAGRSAKIKQAMLDYLFIHQTSERVLACCDVRNGAANHVNFKLGMRLDKVQDEPHNQRQVNHWVLNKSDYENRHRATAQ